MSLDPEVAQSRTVILELSLHMVRPVARRTAKEALEAPFVSKRMELCVDVSISGLKILMSETRISMYPFKKLEAATGLPGRLTQTPQRGPPSPSG